MERLLYLVLVLGLLAGCGQRGAQERKVNARAVPERADDFVFENDFYCYRAYGKALEGNPTSPGFDVWVKNCDSLVAEGRYARYMASGSDSSYHKDHGNGKDCYKVSVSLGGGASSPLIADTLRFPATNYRSSEILESTPGTVSFVLHYPAWEACGYSISLDKTITVTAGDPFAKAVDVYSFTGPSDSLVIAAGLVRHDVVQELKGPDRIALWEHASDTSIEPEDGMIGLALIMPWADSTTIAAGHSLCVRRIESGEPIEYWFSSVWSKGFIDNPDDWFSLVQEY